MDSTTDDGAHLLVWRGRGVEGPHEAAEHDYGEDHDGDDEHRALPPQLRDQPVHGGSS